MCSELTNKQRRFCEEYVIDWNATRAAKAAGYSEKTAYSIGQENLKKPEIQAFLEEIQKDISKLAGVSALRNINKLVEIAFAEDEKTRHTDRIKAIEVINKMLGLNEPEKIEAKTMHEFEGKTEQQIIDDLNRYREKGI